MVALSTAAFGQKTTQLFNGSSLAGWSGDENYWSVEDGVILGRSTPEHPLEKTTYLTFTDGEYRDFDLSVEFKIDGKGGNSGLQFRSLTQDDHQIVGYQADLDFARDWTGGLYEQGGRGVIVRRGLRMLQNSKNTAYELLGDLQELSKLGAPGEWHTYRVRALGTRIQLWIDETLTCDYDDREARFHGGALAFQLHQGPPMEIRYRNIQIEALDAPEVPQSQFDTAKWIWTPEGARDAQVVRFERRVQAKGKVKVASATLHATCDDGVEISINDFVFAGGAQWSAPFSVKLPPRLVTMLNSGKPAAMRAECWNSDGQAALIARLEIVYEDGSVESVETDRWWTTIVDGESVAAQELGPIGMEPWGVPEDESSGVPDLPLAASKFEVQPGYRVEEIMRVPRAYGSWVALTVDDQGRIIAAAEAEHGLFRVTLRDGEYPSVEPLGIEITGAQGLLALGTDLYIVQNVFEGNENGLYRARDADADGRYEELTFLKKLDGSGEHGPHAVHLAPDGAHLEVIAGNATALPGGVERFHVAPNWEDDQLLPSLPDTFGHGNQMHDHGGWLARCDLNGEHWEILTSGIRNSYDFAYDRTGQRFAYDADMEWDMGAPWYRAPRVLHIAPGVEFGWRRGSGKIMETEPDTLPSVGQTGPSSPVGILHGKDSSFPGAMGNTLLVGDWIRGIIYSVPMAAEGDTFRGDPKPFISGRPLPITDMEWLRDGSMAIVTGGRGRRSALYRVAAVEPRPMQPEGQAHEFAVTAPAPGLLAAQQRRASLELDPDLATWAPKALAADDPADRAIGWLALARVGGPSWQAPLLARLIQLDAPLGLPALRSIELSMARAGAPAADLATALRERLEAELPQHDAPIPHDVKLTKLLVFLGSDRAPAFAVPRMLSATTQERALDLAMPLRLAKAGWTPELANAYLDFLHVDARAFLGGFSIEGYLNRIREAALEGAGAALNGLYEPPTLPESSVPAYEMESPSFVEQWSLRKLAPVFPLVPKASDRALGERAFRRAGCYACHRVGEEGGGTGPDLTDAGGRFTARDLLIAIIEPSRDVSDQYRDTEVWTQDSQVYVGRLVDQDGDWTSLQMPPSEPGGLDGELVDIPAEDIKLVRAHPTSRMPSGMLDGLQSPEITELLAWLLDEKSRAPNPVR
ncbi:MAG: putative heme-binding domain-containing protein [Paracoccaceae bacterium]